MNNEICSWLSFENTKLRKEVYKYSYEKQENISRKRKKTEKRTDVEKKRMTNRQLILMFQQFIAFCMWYCIYTSAIYIDCSVYDSYKLLTLDSIINLFYFNNKTKAILDKIFIYAKYYLYFTHTLSFNGYLHNKNGT